MREDGPGGMCVAFRWAEVCDHLKKEKNVDCFWERMHLKDFYQYMKIKVMSEAVGIVSCNTPSCDYLFVAK